MKDQGEVDSSLSVKLDGEHLRENHINQDLNTRTEAESTGRIKVKQGSTSRIHSRPDRKGWTTQRPLGRGWQLRCRRTSVDRRPRKYPTRQINLNKRVPQAGASCIIAGESSSSTPTSAPPGYPVDLKRKLDEFDTRPTSEHIEVQSSKEKVEVMPVKKHKRSLQESEGIEHGEAVHVSVGKEDHDLVSTTKGRKEKQRQKKKKKRKKAEKQSGDEEHRLTMEMRAKQAEAGSSEPRRFLVGIPLASVSGLSGGSVCKYFRKRDLTLNDILPVPLETLLATLPAGSLYQSLRSPIYFSTSCKEHVARLKQRLKNAAVCSKLHVITEEHFNEVILQGVPSGDHLPRLLCKQTLVAIEQVLDDAQPPHEIESSQNAEDKIKCLFKPILRSLGLHDTIITTGFSWKEKIGLRSTTDLGTHNYGPKSDAAIIRVLNDKEAEILVLFEAYSRLGQSLRTPDENRADRVRLLIQGSYISIRDGKPSVVFYLTRDKYMETILIFADDADQTKFGYYAEKQPFYDEVTWVDLICQIINLI